MSKLSMPVDPARDHSEGSADAPVTLVEYGDYECPYCGQAYPIVKKIQATLGGERLRFVFRNFPLTELHPHAGNAARAAETAGAMGGESAFWKMHDALYEHQRSLGDAHLSEMATSIGLDGKTLLSEMLHGKHDERIQEDFSSGVRSGVNGTPTFFINGVRFDGAWNEEAAFLAALKEAGA